MCNAWAKCLSGLVVHHVLDWGGVLLGKEKMTSVKERQRELNYACLELGDYGYGELCMFAILVLGWRSQ